MSELIVMKLGGSVITKKEQDEPKVNYDNLKRLAREVSEAQKETGARMIIVHGAGPFGHVYAKHYKLHLGLNEVKEREGIGITQKWMEYLNHEVVKALQEEGLSCMPFQPSAGGVMKNGTLINYPDDVVEKFLGLGVNVVCHGDVLLDEDKGIGILSGDTLAPYLAEKLGATKIVFGADVDGVYEKDPKKNPDAKLIKKVTPKNINEVVKELGGSQGTDVTGGMAKKVKELLALAEKGTESQIVNASKEGFMKKALLGDESIGTMINNE